MGESFDHCSPGWIRQSRKGCTQSIHNRMVVDYLAMSSVNFAISDSCSLVPEGNRGWRGSLETVPHFRDGPVNHHKRVSRGPTLSSSWSPVNSRRLPASIEDCRFRPIHAHCQIENAAARWQPVRLMICSRILILNVKIE
jgi:hypothetical protein